MMHIRYEWVSIIKNLSEDCRNGLAGAIGTLEKSSNIKYVVPGMERRITPVYGSGVDLVLNQRAHYRCASVQETSRAWKTRRSKSLSRVHVHRLRAG